MTRSKLAGSRRLRAGILVGILVGASPVGASQAMAQGPAVPPSAAQSGERHTIVVPDGWQMVHQSITGTVDTLSYVPAGQTAERWQDMLTIQVVRSAVGAAALSPDALYDQTQASYEQACDGVKLGGLQSGDSNGYVSAFWVLGCAKVKTAGYGEAAFFRTIQGNSALYMAQWAWRVSPFDVTVGPPLLADQQKEALETLQSFRVCDPARKEHPCTP